MAAGRCRHPHLRRSGCDQNRWSQSLPQRRFSLVGSGHPAGLPRNRSRLTCRTAWVSDLAYGVLNERGATDRDDAWSLDRLPPVATPSSRHPQRSTKPGESSDEFEEVGHGDHGSSVCGHRYRRRRVAGAVLHPVLRRRLTAQTKGRSERAVCRLRRSAGARDRSRCGLHRARLSSSGRPRRYPCP